MHLLTLLLVLMFALVIAYFCYCVYFYGGRWVANPITRASAAGSGMSSWAR